LSIWSEVHSLNLFKTNKAFAIADSINEVYEAMEPYIQDIKFKITKE
jgi:hypothetical protein